MTDAPVPATKSCASCGRAMTETHAFCPACGVARDFVTPMRAAAPQVLVESKSAGIAILLTFLWLGAGHLYLNRINSGLILLMGNLFLWILVMTFFGIIIAFPLWLVLFIVTALRVADHVRSFNRRLGVR